MDDDSEVIAWLLAGDAACRHQTGRDLLDNAADLDPGLLAAVPSDGAAAAILAARHTDGHWGLGFYQPKWTSTHYSLLELAELGLPGDHAAAVASTALVVRDCKGADGGLNPRGSQSASDACINGMGLRYAAHFGAPLDDLVSIVDFLLAWRMDDGGFNCQANRSGVSHSSMHTTVCVMEGCAAYLAAGYSHRADEVRAAQMSAAEFLLQHNVFRSHRTGEPIRPAFMLLHHPARWHFDVLRGMEALVAAGVIDDPRTRDALSVLTGHRRPDGRWAAARGYPGETHVAYPRAGEPNRWVTLRALRVLRRVCPSG
ncbi:MAG: hypothetical protein WAR57_00580 [Candidatus Phosphoribacter sp.]|nr:hypothetical protein [Actinomycetales bacterium]